MLEKKHGLAPELLKLIIFNIQKEHTMTRRKATTRRKNSSSINQIPFQELNNPFKPMELISADQVEYIHNASLKILSQIGIQVDSSVSL